MRVAPAGQCSGPVADAPVVRDLLAGFDHRAENLAGEDRGDLAAGDSQHRLVQQGQTFAHLPGVQQQPAAGLETHGGEVAVVPALAGVHDLRRYPQSNRELPGVDVAHHLVDAKVAALHQVVRHRLQQSKRAGDPSGPDGRAAVRAVDVGQPVGVADCGERFAGLDVAVEGLLQRFGRDVTVADEVRGDGEASEVRRGQVVDPDRAKLLVRRAPGPAGEGLSSLDEDSCDDQRILLFRGYAGRGQGASGFRLPVTRQGHARAVAGTASPGSARSGGPRTRHHVLRPG